LLKGFLTGAVQLAKLAETERRMAPDGFGGATGALDLTSVHQPFAETGRIAISLLFAAMDGTAGSIQQISLKPSLTLGGTT